MWLAVLLLAALAGVASAVQGWSIPPTAAAEQSPGDPDGKQIARGQSLYRANCASCHGSSGRGDGPAGDAKAPPADLTDPSVADTNADGVLFYKIWNGRKAPDMPAFKSRMTRDDVWRVVAYVKTLRRSEPR